MTSVAFAGADPLVAVVTPVYNGEPWLARTMACVQAQTYPNLVHVVLDNASTDGTAETIARFTGGAVPIIARRNGEVLPQAQNWNAAFAAAPADAVYLKLLCADDLMRPDAIERLVAVAEADPDIDFVSAIDIFDDRAMPHRLNPSEPVFDGPSFARTALLRESGWIAPHQAFFRAAVDAGRRYYDETLATQMDIDMLLRCLCNRKIGFVFEPLYYTRYSNLSVTAVTNGNRASVAYHGRLVHRYGPSFFSGVALKRAQRRALQWLARRLPAWILEGDVGSVALSYRVLQEAGWKVSLGDMIFATLSWPWAVVEKALAKGYAPAEHGPMTEEAFLAQSLSAARPRRVRVASS